MSDFVLISEHGLRAEGNLRIIVGITGASGSVYGWRLLEKLRANASVEIHLVLSRAGERTAFLEMGKTAADFKQFAHHWYPVEDIGCAIASGSNPWTAWWWRPAPSTPCPPSRQASPPTSWCGLP